MVWHQTPSAQPMQVPASNEDLLISFKAFDLNRDGKLSKAELYEVLQGNDGCSESVYIADSGGMF